MKIKHRGMDKKIRYDKDREMKIMKKKKKKRKKSADNREIMR